MGICLDIAYGIAGVLAAPIWVTKMITQGRYRSGWASRFGRVPRQYGLQPTIWIHGVSLGEINAAKPLVDALRQQLPDHRIVVSTSTDTGFAAAQRHFAPGLTIFRWPLDFTLAVQCAIDRIQPALVVMLEGEIWPNFLAACKKRNIPTAVVNGRMSPDKGYPRYKKLGSLGPKLLFNRITQIGVQNDIYADRFVQLGTDPDRVRVTGMMKYDNTPVGEPVAGAASLRETLGVVHDAPLLVCGGTGPGEEEMLLDIYPKLKEQFPTLRLAIVPRKPERFGAVASMIEARQLPLLRRTTTQQPGFIPDDAPADAVILGDTMGELKAFYSVASVVFVGRSLVPMGGSDMIEPAALGKPTCFGPHTFNFPQADDLVLHGCRRVPDIASLQEVLCSWLADAALAKQAGQAAQDFVLSQQGATQRNVAMLCELLHRQPAFCEGGIATDCEISQNG